MLEQAKAILFATWIKEAIAKTQYFIMQSYVGRKYLNKGFFLPTLHNAELFIRWNAGGVINDGRSADSTSYMWVHRSSEYYKDRSVILYEYQKTRRHRHPEEFYKGFRGILVTTLLKSGDALFCGVWLDAYI